MGIEGLSIARPGFPPPIHPDHPQPINERLRRPRRPGRFQKRLGSTLPKPERDGRNIQDAESTIRDTDVAEEMMSYVKNNILVQSAQAMLAQANQLPQGVLQLLGLIPIRQYFFQYFFSGERLQAAPPAHIRGQGLSGKIFLPAMQNSS